MGVLPKGILKQSEFLKLLVETKGGEALKEGRTDVFPTISFGTHSQSER